MHALWLISIICLGYLVGAFPSAYIMGKMFAHADIRKVGSGNVGATNVARASGVFPGMLTLVLDMGKGFIFVWGVKRFLISGSNVFEMSLLPLLAGLATIVGHDWTIFLKFKGGKGVATTLGVCLALYPKVAVSVILVWLIVVLLMRYVSLASLVSVLSLPVFIWIYFKGYDSSILYLNITCGVIFALLVLWRHQSNIKRLIHHQERKLSFLKSG